MLLSSNQLNMKNVDSKLMLRCPVKLGHLRAIKQPRLFDIDDVITEKSILSFNMVSGCAGGIFRVYI